MPNAKVLSEKQAIVAALAERLKGASAGVFVDYKGITVDEDTKLRTGVAPLDALRILNGTYLLRGDGCFSTVDLLHIDLTSGEAELLKWGAAPSYLRCGDTVKKLGTASLPPGVGVGGDHAPERYRLSLRGGEMLVLVSDGAGDAESAVAGFAGDSPRELAALLIAGLPAEDDMTAVAVALAPRASRD